MLLTKGKELRAQGLSWRKVGAELGLDEGTLRKALKREDEDKSPA
jgi:lambda repressor-like predicted transcriptional regulator